MNIETLKANLARAISERGITANALSIKAGITNTTARDILNGRTPHPRIDTIAALAHALGLSVSELLGDAVPKTTAVMVRASVEAGVWREAVELPEDEWEEIPALVHPDFEGHPVFGLRVRGRSMDKKFEPGAYLVCVSYINLDREPISGEFVIVERRQPSGLTEATVKEFVIQDGRPMLKAHSTLPEYAEPWYLDALTDSEEVRITSRVLMDVRLR